MDETERAAVEKAGRENWGYICERIEFYKNRDGRVYLDDVISDVLEKLHIDFSKEDEVVAYLGKHGLEMTVRAALLGIPYEKLNNRKPIDASMVFRLNR